MKNNIKQHFFHFFLDKCARVPLKPLTNQFINNSNLHISGQNQLRLIKRLLNFAYKYSPYYSSLFLKNKISIKDIQSLYDFSYIPILTKSIIQANKNIIISKHHQPIKFTFKTSGSTGTPVTLYKDRIGVASTYASMYKCHSWYNVKIGATEARLWNYSNEIAKKMKTRFLDFALGRISYIPIYGTDTSYFFFYNQIKRNSPDYLMGYPSLIYSFTTFLKEKNLSVKFLNLKFIKCTGEILHDYQKEFISNFFDCPCINEYGSTETGIIAFECPHGNLHVQTDAVFVEFSSSNETDLFKHPIVTNLYNYIFPIIRYKVDDLVLLDENDCKCGRKTQVIKSIVGRSHDFIYSKGSSFHSSLLAPLLKETLLDKSSINNYIIVQNRVDEIDIIIQLKTKEQRRSIVYQLKKAEKKYFYGKIGFNIYFAESISRPKDNKYRYFYPLKDRKKNEIKIIYSTS